MKAGSILDGKYELVRHIGDGRMGALWEGRNVRTEREVAVKLLLASGREEDKQRLLREARAGGRIRHPNVLDVYDVAETESGSPFIVMELLHGETLAERIERAPLPLVQALTVLRDVARGLGAAHKVGVVHRDLQPKNIFLHDEADAPLPKVKLVEFGISRIDSEATLAVKGATTIGSPAYIAPEQAYGRPIDARTDIWAFGVLAFELLVGAPPFDGATIGEIVHQVTTGPIPEVPSIAAELDADLRQLVDRCLVRNADARLQVILDAVPIIDKLLERLADPSMTGVAARPPSSPADDDGPTTVLNGTASARAAARAARVSITEIRPEPRTVRREPRPVMPSDSDEHPLPTRHYARPRMESAPTQIAGVPERAPPLAVSVPDGTPTDADIEISNGAPADADGSDDDGSPDTLVSPPTADDDHPPPSPDDELRPANASPVRTRRPSDSLLDPQSDRASESRGGAIPSSRPPPPKRPFPFLVLGVLVAVAGGIGIVAFMQSSSTPARTPATSSVAETPASAAAAPTAADTQASPPTDPIASPSAVASALASAQATATATASADVSASAADSASAKPKPPHVTNPIYPHPLPVPVPQPPTTTFTPSSL